MRCLLRCLVLIVGSSVLSACAPETTTSTVTPIELPSIGDRLSDAAQAVLRAPDVFEVLSIDPMSGWEDPAEDAALFHDYVELGRAAVDDAALQRQVVALLYKGIRENDEMVAACFNPRHGVHAVKGETTVDLVICYECLQIYVFVDDGERASCLTGESVEPALSRIWRDIGLTIAK